MGDNRAFLGETFDMFRLLLHVTERNEEREISVLVPGRFEHAVEGVLHVFPDAIAPGLDHHAAADVARLGQVGRANHLLIPLGKILRATRTNRGFGLVGLGHGEARYLYRATGIDQRPFPGAHWSSGSHRSHGTNETNRTNTPQGVDTSCARRYFPRPSPDSSDENVFR